MMQHIRINRGDVYYHHGILLVQEKHVIHFDTKKSPKLPGPPNFLLQLLQDKLYAEIVFTATLDAFLDGAKQEEIEIVHSLSTDDDNKYRQALERIQHVQTQLPPYNLLQFNCEHLSNYIISGEAVSHQVRKYLDPTLQSEKLKTE